MGCAVSFFVTFDFLLHMFSHVANTPPLLLEGAGQAVLIAGAVYQRLAAVITLSITQANFGKLELCICRVTN